MTEKFKIRPTNPIRDSLGQVCLRFTSTQINTLWPWSINSLTLIISHQGRGWCHSKRKTEWVRLIFVNRIANFKLLPSCKLLFLPPFPNTGRLPNGGSRLLVSSETHCFHCFQGALSISKEAEAPSVCLRLNLDLPLGICGCGEVFKRFYCELSESLL